MRVMAGNLEYDILPDNVKPVHYDLFLSDIEIDGREPTYNGLVKIRVVVQKPTDVIVLNAQGLDLLSAYIRLSDGREIQSSEIREDEDAQRCFLQFPEVLTPTESVEIIISFEGEIDDDLSGFFRFKDSKLASPGQGHEYVASTQLQPCDARCAFPCFDEPALKATFDLSIEVPPGLQALSNMPILKTEPKKGKPGYDVVKFQRTPVMSTYLLAWAIGSFEYLETTITRKHSQTPLPIRVYCPPGLKKDAQFALNVASRTVEYFSEIFEIDYPLPKLDLLSLRELSDEAMENWGLVTFRTTVLLVDEDTSDLDSTTRAAYIIAHELAHQWFGNLVTMTWWDDLWLNEGFATWAGWAACDKFFPEWDLWGQFIVDDMQEGFDLDTLPSSHPIRVHVPDGLEVDSIFDDISYLKSAAVIRMLAAHVGESSFLQGVACYLKSNAYGSGTATDLWASISKSTSQDIASLMEPWIESQGYPLVIAQELSTDSKIVVSQHLASSKPWPIPLLVQTATGSRHEMLIKTPVEYEISSKLSTINADQAGFFRTKLPAPYLQKLCESLHSISTHEQAGILTDIIALAWTGNGPSTDEVLKMLPKFASLTNAVVWDAIASVLDRIDSTFSDDEDISESLDLFTLRLAEPMLDQLGWSFKGNDEDHNTKRLRTTLIELVGMSGGKSCIEKASSSTRAWLQGEEDAIDPLVRLPILKIAIQNHAHELMDPHWDLYSKSKSAAIRDQIAEALGQIQERKLAHACLHRAFGGEMITQDIETLAGEMVGSPHGRENLWSFMMENWTVVEDRMAGSMAIFDPFIGNTIRPFATQEAQERFAGFFATKDTTGYRRGLTVAMDFISMNAMYRKRDVERLRSWLQEVVQNIK